MQSQSYMAAMKPIAGVASTLPLHTMGLGDMENSSADGHVICGVMTNKVHCP